MAVSRPLLSRDILKHLQAAVAPCTLNFAAVVNDHTKYLLQLKYGEHTWEYPLNLEPCVEWHQYMTELQATLRTMRGILLMGEKQNVYHYPSQLQPVDLYHWEHCTIPFINET